MFFHQCLFAKEHLSQPVQETSNTNFADRGFLDKKKQGILPDNAAGDTLFAAHRLEGAARLVLLIYNN